MEQITYLLFLRRLDDLYTLEENKSLRLGTPMERRMSLIAVMEPPMIGVMEPGHDRHIGSTR